MDYVDLNDPHPSFETVRRWAYDENLLLIDQDEDLILHNVEYTRLLLQLAREPECPKRDYCLSIVYYYSQIMLLARVEQTCRELLACIDPEVVASPVTTRWATPFRYAYDRLATPRPMTFREAESLAKWLLVGDYCKRSFSRTDRVVSGFHEFRCWTESYNGYLYINLYTGMWRHSGGLELSRIPE